MGWKEIDENSGIRGIFFFCFNFEGKKVAEKRDIVTNYPDYLNRWDLIEQALQG
jgi:hypothetical protein